MLLFKILCTPLLILASVLATRRWGAFVGGCVAGLPSISGPISFCIAVEQGPFFAAAVAHNALLGVWAVCLFTLAYAWMALRYQWHLTLLVAILAYFASGWVLSFIPHIPALAVAAGVSGPLATIALLPNSAKGTQNCVRPHARWILPAQMVFGVLLVVVITGTATRLGPHWSGILTFFPVGITILAPFCHSTLGVSATLKLIAGIMTGFMGGISFMVVVFFTVERLPLALCYTLASVITLIICILLAKIQKAVHTRNS